MMMVVQERLSALVVNGQKEMLAEIVVILVRRITGGQSMLMEIILVIQLKKKL